MTNRIEPVASADYYLCERVDRSLPELRLTLLFFPQWRDALTSQMVLFDELRELLSIADQGVAMTKLAWWYEEWQRLCQGQPRHPLTRALLRSQTDLPALDPALKVVAAILGGSAPQTVVQLRQWLDGLAAPLVALEPGGEAVQDSWRRIWLLALLSDLQPLARVGRAPWPMDLAAASQLVREQLAQPASSEQAAGQLWQALGSGPCPPAGHAPVFLALRQATALRVAKGRKPAGRWQQLWLTWRAATRSRAAGAAG